MFCGIGDARHFHATVTRIDEHEKTSGSNDRRYHFTLVNLKASVLARDMIVLHLVDELAMAKFGAERNIIVAIYFIFISTIIPAKAHEKMQSTIANMTIRK